MDMCVGKCVDVAVDIHLNILDIHLNICTVMCIDRCADMRKETVLKMTIMANTHAYAHVCTHA